MFCSHEVSEVEPQKECGEERKQAELESIRRQHPKIQQLSPLKVGLQMCAENHLRPSPK